MFERLFRTIITEISNIEKRNAISEAFCQRSIEYIVKSKDIYQRNAMDAATIGQAVFTL